MINCMFYELPLDCINTHLQCELEVTQCELTLGLWETRISSNENA